ncbi:VCBS domain-containing protein [Bradyrhizobium genosp. A]|uniref:VCBS domain-containing protein n=1 Tax=Bradyrhizobium genosp. A TaxID=83626 RepID=UPI003CF16149
MSVTSAARHGDEREAAAARHHRVKTAKSSSLDRPVSPSRERVSTGRFGLLSLAALLLSTTKEVKAADPNVTLLDDDTITYKDLTHGAFELVTKEPIPRHIIVDDPGETIVLKKVGSSVSVNQVTNTATRMEELQAAQQDALANLEGQGPHGSGTPPFVKSLPLQPINFIPADAPAPQNLLPPVQFVAIPVPEIPAPALAITSIGGQIAVAADNIINASRANAGVAITGTTSGVEDGRVVTVTIVDGSNHVVYSGTATITDSTWSINVSPANARALADGIYTLTADVSNSAGIPADASQAIRVDETPPTIAINTVVGNNVVNANAASTGFVIAGETSDAENGQPVTVKIVDSSGQVVDTFTTTLTNSTWSVNVSSTDAKLLHDGTYTVTADVSDSAGNPAPQATQTIAVDETPPIVTWLPRAESGIEGTAIALGTITATVNSVPGHGNNVQSLVVSDIPAGALLTDGTNNFMATSGNTSVEVNGWNLSNLKIVPPNDTNFFLTLTATDRDANTASTSELVTVVPSAPDLNPVAAHGNEDTAIALDLGATAKSLSGANGETTPNSLDTLVVSDIPVGATLSDGTGLPGHSFTATAGNTSHDVVGWNLSSLQIRPPAEFEGRFTLTIAATERDSEGDISATVTAAEVVTVAPVAEQPTAGAPATLKLDEKATDAAVIGVSVGPLAEDNNDTVSATLRVSHGTLHVGSLSGVTVTGDGSATLTLSGSAAAVNGLLAGLTYTPTTEYEGSDTLVLSVTSNDGSNTNPTAATASTAITVNPVAAPPTASAPATLTLNEDATGVAVVGVGVGPLAEDNDDTVSATLKVSHGTLHVGSLSGVTVTGDDSATLTVSGSAAAVNGLLAGLTYTPTSEYEGSDILNLSVTSSDGANTNPTAATASTAITVNSVAAPPTASAPTTLTVNEDATGVAVIGVSVGPLAEDNDDTVSATLTVSHGALHVGSLSGVTVTGDDSATLTLSGSAAAVNMLLAGLSYTPAQEVEEEEEDSDTLHLSVTSSDGSNTYPTVATAATAITIIEDSESLIVGGPGPTLNWSDPDNWSGRFVPTLSTHTTINAPSLYTVIITDTAHAAALTIPHGAASTDVTASGTLQLAGDLDVSDSGKLENDGTLEETANSTFIGPITNNGTIILDPNVRLDVTGTITGVGKFWIDSGTTLEFALGSKVAPGTTDSQIIYFEQGAGKLIIDDFGKFAGVITGAGIGTHLTSADLIDLTQLPFVGGSMSASVSYSSATDISTIIFTDGISANNVTLHLSGNYTSAAWSFTSLNGGAGTEISDPPANSGTVTGGATGAIAAARAATTDFANAGGPNTSLVLDNSQNFAGQLVAFTRDGTARPLPAGQTFTSSPTNSESDDGYGTFAMTAAGLWTYPLDNNNNVVQALDVGDTPTDTFTITTGDGATQVVTIAIHGASDAAPNDFDNLATGPVVTSGPPFAPAAHGSETIAGGDDTGQIISAGVGKDIVNGTGKADILYGGCGNDTIKGNGGDDTIYGGSGNDTINGNNGNDTIIGGFGADHLTGGNGSDRFVYLSVADSSAGQFDTITDFTSGTDKIDLTALGALGFVLLALSPASTSVPAHTIAWLYDSTANETIVYVNPTDQTLRIGNSGLLEIHLQGIATIDASDFILTPVAAPVLAAGSGPFDLSAATQSDATAVTMTSSSGTTLSDGTLLADWSSTDRSTDAAYSVLAAMDQFGWTEYSSFSGSDGVQTRAAEITNIDAVMPTPSGLSMTLHHVAAPTETRFVFDHLAMPDSTDTAARKNDVIAGSGLMPDIARAALNSVHDAAEQLARRGHTLESGDEDHDASAPENADHAHAHGGTGNDSADTKLDPSLLKSPTGSGASQSHSSEASGQHDAPRHGTVDIDPPSAGHVAPGSAPFGSHQFGGSFHFKDGVSHGRGDLSAGWDDPSDPSGHHEHAGVVHVSGAAPMPELSPPHIDPAHGAGTIGAHALHDLIV